jgi:hypothetical protein
MTLALWKRTVLGTMVALSVAGASLTTFSAAQAAPGGNFRENCYHVTSDNACENN